MVRFNLVRPVSTPIATLGLAIVVFACLSPSTAAAAEDCDSARLDSLAGDVAYNSLVEFDDVVAGDITKCRMDGTTSSFRLQNHLFINCQGPCEVEVWVQDRAVKVFADGSLLRKYGNSSRWIKQIHMEGTSAEDDVFVVDDATQCLDTFTSTYGGEDVVVTGCGDDRVNSGHDDDFVSTLGGDDSIWASRGADVVFAGGGDDYIKGYYGDDLVYGGSGNDALYLGEDDDLAFGGDGHDDLHGNSGDDILYGGNGDDDLYGNSGSDVLVGEDDDDDMDGDTSRDLLWGGDGSDEADGGSGNDKCSSENKSGCDSNVSNGVKDDIRALRTAGYDFADDMADAAGATGNWATGAGESGWSWSVGACRSTVNWWYGAMASAGNATNPVFGTIGSGLISAENWISGLF